MMVTSSTGRFAVGAAAVVGAAAAEAAAAGTAAVTSFFGFGRREPSPSNTKARTQKKTTPPITEPMITFRKDQMDFGEVVVGADMRVTGGWACIRAQRDPKATAVSALSTAPAPSSA